MIALALISVIAAAPLAKPQRPETTETMHAALRAVASLQPYLASPGAFHDPANAIRIAADLQTLSFLKHRFLAPKKQEPGLEAIGGLFGDYVARARVDFKAGDTEAARLELRSVTTLCLSCHTLQSASRDFDDAARLVDALNLTPLRRAEFFATTRQFDRAVAAWNQALEVAPVDDVEAFEQASALRQYTSVLVRVKGDRDATVALLVKQLERKQLPTFIHRTLEWWLTDAREWQADAFVATAATPAALFAKAKAIIEGAGAAKTPLTNEARFISMLRATAYLHEALRASPQAAFRGEALYLLGVASAATLDPLLWDLDNLFLEACIRENPHSAIAKRCVERLYDRAWLTWSGSGSTNIPGTLARRLGELRDLAQ